MPLMPFTDQGRGIWHDPHQVEFGTQHFVKAINRNSGGNRDHQLAGKVDSLQGKADLLHQLRLDRQHDHIGLLGRDQVIVTGMDPGNRRASGSRRSGLGAEAVILFAG